MLDKNKLSSTVTTEQNDVGHGGITSNVKEEVTRTKHHIKTKKTKTKVERIKRSMMTNCTVRNQKNQE